MVMRTDPWNTRSAVSRWAQIFERSRFALADGSCGLFAMTSRRLVGTAYRRIRACLKALIERIDLTNFPGSCCG
jgi:hypothetical protein